jgi:hypothetical protein
VLGGTPRLFWGAIAAGAAVATLAIAASPAAATTDRVDYSDQANPICISTSKQIEQLYESFEAQLERLDEPHRAKNRRQARRQARKLGRRFDRLYEQLPIKVIALYRIELQQLNAIAPPPGYEDSVARWLANRSEIFSLYEQYLQIDRELEGPLVDRGKGGKRPSRKAIKRAQKRYDKLYEREEQIEGRIANDLEVDLELGTKLGAAYCVTGADGEIDVIDVDDWDD